MSNKKVTGERRRLAVIDTSFPWKRSGFRYWESTEIIRQRPDTLFFATYVYHDEFPAVVHPLSSFKEVAKREEITDIYCVFLNLATSLLGCTSLSEGVEIPGSNPQLDIFPFMKEQGMTLHTTLYPGGGLGPDTHPDFLKKVEARCGSVFTNIQEVRKEIPSSIFMPVVINTDFYSYRDKSIDGKLQLTFAAHRAERKGFPLLVDIFNQLDNDFHLNIIGNWQNDLHLLTNRNFTFYGVLSPSELRRIYQQSHVFLYTGSQDRFALDGFPTTAAADAMATGCLLISTNPRKDRFTLEAGADFLEVEDNAAAFVDRLKWVNQNRQQGMGIGKQGSATIRKLFDCKKVVESKLSHIFNS